MVDPEDNPEIRPVTGYAEFLEALAVRVEVFVREQGGPPEDEPDAWDWSARHFVVITRGCVVGTARVYQPGSQGVLKIGRVALLPEYRRRGWGTRLLQELLRYVRSLGIAEVWLDAQTAARAFYERLGFTAVGEEFLDAGIPHRRMRWGASRPLILITQT